MLNRHWIDMMLLVLTACCSVGVAHSSGLQHAADGGQAAGGLHSQGAQHTPGSTDSKGPEQGRHTGRGLQEEDSITILNNGSGTVYTPSSNSIPLNGDSTALAMMGTQPQAAAATTTRTTTVAMQRYLRVRASRIMHLVADVAWLVYAIGNFAHRTFALLVPLVKIGQTGELTLNAASFLNLAQLVADFICRFGDMFAKLFLVVFRGIILAATLPPTA